MKKYEVSEISLLEGFSSSNFLIINKSLMRVMEAEKVLYLSFLIDRFLYFYRSNLLEDEFFYCTHETVMEHILISENTLRSCKRWLKEKEIIDTKTKGLPAKEYLKINIETLLNYVYEIDRTSPLKSSRSIPLKSSRSIPLKSSRSNIYKTNNIKNKSIENKSSLWAADEKITPSMFEDFWKLYPKKTDEGKALTAWNKICNKKDRPTWKKIRTAIHYQKKTERWQDKTFIPHPTTWLNQSRWLDDPEQMKVFKKESPVKDQPKTAFRNKTDQYANLKVEKMPAWNAKWEDTNTDASGNCFSDADSGL